MTKPIGGIYIRNNMDQGFVDMSKLKLKDVSTNKY